MTYLYSKISSDGYLGSGGLTTFSIYAGLSADELSLHSSVGSLQLLAFYRNDLSVNTGGYEFWSIIYSHLFVCNSMIEGLNNNTSISAIVQKQLLSEAKFMRALLYWYLINIYGDVPLIHGTDYKINSGLSRSPKSEVIASIIKDLEEAEQFLSKDYLDRTLLKVSSERIRPNKYAASAMLARAYLYNKEYSKAISKSTEIITQDSFYGLTELENVFLKNSKEAIWQLQPVNSNWNTEDARIFILPSTGPNNSSNPVFLSPYLVNAFEIGDRRKEIWTSVYSDITGDYFYPTKYKNATNGLAVTEYLMVLRLAEQYLIRAEARVMQGNIEDGISDVNLLRARARDNIPGSLPNLPNSLNKEEALMAIIQERKIELFTEWGHRWLDLKRYDIIDNIMSSVTSQKRWYLGYD
ncbi:RagB/SusD family nutrient uptake outer membrane protein [Paraflavitalea speifideaquila]|uniref:RagB/SusD family nutrient uptake outer membrane protein n=1 Tax=Paraflavitalea speifideaquila TaxID=3076558 RepID=UPI0028EB4C42|nr:RagB/SusD family nutrient uptake outer membrane protein [Paraflavitalea speifideiaquila]